MKFVKGDAGLGSEPAKELDKTTGAEGKLRRAIVGAKRHRLVDGQLRGSLNTEGHDLLSRIVDIGIGAESIQTIIRCY
ncbi:hypothetical protein ColTof4_14043 [Colletotrichum tofieldiae]|nr:hypothetical protein ColTof3_14678 [Colletotrichum tofieldiae]GKT81620.1 hypothetical protein ColTof4_14043 [Colletotrichum tofieldiae]GKT97594.1 hypothetical protein Ct61P_15444 [Colletotrichum tofieldiae]